MAVRTSILTQPRRSNHRASLAFLCGLLAAAAAAIMQARRVRATGPGASSEASFRAITAAMLLVAEMLVAVLLSQTALVALCPSMARQPILVVTLGAVAVVALSAVLLWLGQGGSRRAGASAGGAPVGDRTPDSAWVLGMFYVNRDDPSILVEKRFGIGYTVNFGHPITWVLVGLLVAILVTVGVVRLK